MPKIFGTNLLGIAIGGLLFWMIGYLWYGPVFGSIWLDIQGMTEEMAKAQMEETGVAVVMGSGILISLVTAIGLSFILHHASASVLATCVKICAIVATLVVLPVMAFAVLYEGYPMKGLILDFGYILVGFAAMGAVMSFFRGKDAIDPT